MASNPTEKETKDDWSPTSPNRNLLGTLATLDNEPSSVWKLLKTNLLLSIGYPPHDPRTQDPYLHVFETTRTQLVKENPTCWRCGSRESLEGHHLLQWVFHDVLDIEKLKKDFPNFTGTTEEDKHIFLNGKENIVLLCKDCHTQTHGIHKIPHPLWLIKRYIKDDIAEETVKVIEKSPVRKTVSTVAGVVPETLSRIRQKPMGNMRMSTALRRLLR